jgi:hypothetical protein
MDNQQILNYSKSNLDRIPIELIYHICNSIISFRDLLNFMKTCKVYYNNLEIGKIMTFKYDYKTFCHDYWMTMYLYNARENNLLFEHEVNEMKTHFSINYDYEDLLPYQNKFNRFANVSQGIIPLNERIDPTLYMVNYVMCFCDSEICKKEMYIYETQEEYCLYCELVGTEFCNENPCKDFSKFFRYKTSGISKALKSIEIRKKFL